MSFLRFENKKYLVVGMANKKSVAFHIAKIVTDEGGEVIFSVQDEDKKKAVARLFPTASCYICDVADKSDIDRLAESVSAAHGHIDGMVHSLAFANFSNGMVPFHEVSRDDFVQAMNISCFSLVELSNAFKDIFSKNGSVVTISISSTRTASENYGYMAPIKAALDSSLVFLAKSFSSFSEVRFNAVAPSLLKTSASAGIPGYVDSYLFAEKLILRKRAITTTEAANTAVFLLSDASSGINAQKIVVDSGMGVNSFDSEVVSKVVR